MSCDIAMAGALWLASLTQSGLPQPDMAQPGMSQPPLTFVSARAPMTSALAREPLYAGIVAEARGLKGLVDGWRRAGTTPGFETFKARIAALAALDMKGHLDLAARGTDGDLKCILKGISLDLPKKLDEVAGAATPLARDQALRDLAYLLNDNVEVITAPPRPAV